MPDVFRIVKTMEEDRSATPEEALWGAVLEQAIHDYNDIREKRQIAAIRGSAIYWLKNLKDKNIGSFIWVCNLFNIDSDRARKAIFNQ